MTNTAFDKIKTCIDNKKSFILEAWAWSWKTYTLIQTVRYLIDTYWNDLKKKWQKITCITYTNIAKEEMIKRLDYNELVEINTIHEFLWSIIWHYQTNLKKELIKYNEEKFELDKRVDNLEQILMDQNVIYTWKYWRNFAKWILHHDDVINLWITMINNYPKLIDIIIYKYPYFFIDEYQDTFKWIIDIFISKILNWNQDKFILWFFWDSMQKIYQDNRVWKINSNLLETIEKVENFRSYKKIVSVINNVRWKNDNLVQIAQKDLDWEITFYYNNSLTDIEKYTLVKQNLNWDFDINPEENKILVLTNKKISDDLWYRNLVDVYEKRFWQHWKDILEKKDEAYSEFILDKIEKIIFYFDNKRYIDFFELFWDYDFKINKLDDRKVLKDLIIGLKEIRETWKVLDVFNYIYEKNILYKNDKITKFENDLLEKIDDPELLDRQNKNKNFQENLFSLEYKEFIKFNEYIENKTPYSTQHWTKWAEYDNILLVMDDSLWNMYNYKKFTWWEKLNKDPQKELESKERLLNLLYVSLSRAKKKLVVLYLSEINNASLEWWWWIFWKENIKIIS